ncbi:MAG: hypothetical protein V2A67_04335 [Bacteroidota bacterium]
MAIFPLQELKNRITDRIRQNWARLISGIDLQEILHDIIDSLAAQEGSGSGSDSGFDRTDYGLSGLLNGENTIFSSSEPYVPGTTRVFLNGIRQFRGEDYQELGEGYIEFSEPPFTGDLIIMDYKY